MFPKIVCLAIFIWVYWKCKKLLMYWCYIKTKPKQRGFEYIGPELVCNIFTFADNFSSVRMINKYCRFQSRKIWKKEQIYVETSLYYPQKYYFYTLPEYKNKKTRFLHFDPNNDKRNSSKQVGFMTTRGELSKKLQILF